MNKSEEILEKHTLWQGEKAVRTEEDMLLAMEEYAEWKLKNCNLQNVSQQSEQLVNFLWKQYKINRLITKKAYMQMVANARKLTICG